jgi:DNA-binding SARP family transcriptional activator
MALLNPRNEATNVIASIFVTRWGEPPGPDEGSRTERVDRENERALNLELLAEVWGEDRLGVGGRLGIDPAIEEEPEVVRRGSGDSLVQTLEDERRSQGDVISPRMSPGVLVDVRVLGPVEVVGWRTLPDRRIITELCCYLALHSERPVSGEELIVAIWPDGGREASPKTLRTYLSLLRSSLGADLFPESVKGAGYQLDPAVSTDWYSFQAFQRDAASVSQDDASLEGLLLRQALQLVRSTPFAGAAAGTFGWAWTELLVSRMEQEIATVAVRLADLLIARGDHQRSAWAAERGLMAVPFDESLAAPLDGGLGGRRRIARARMEGLPSRAQRRREILGTARRLASLRPVRRCARLTDLAPAPVGLGHG